MAGWRSGLRILRPYQAVLGIILLWRTAPTFTTGSSALAPARVLPRAAESSASEPSGATSLKPPGMDGWQVKVAHAVDVLHDDVPEMFLTYGGMGGHMPDFSIYSDEIQFVDERAPGMVMRGLPMYKHFLSALRWSLRSMFEESKLEITSMGRTLVNSQLSVRWRLHLWPKGLMNLALEMLSPSLKSWGFHQNVHHEWEAPFIVEGYSNYEFDPWTAEVTRHSVDIKNPPLFITDLLKQYSTSEIHAVPYGRLSVPYGMQSLSLRGSGKGFQFAGASLGQPVTPEAPAVTRQAGSNWPVPESCEDDFDCNGGRANFPLQCCELPLLGKFCCKPPDGETSPDSKDPAWLPLPVPSNDR